MIHEIEPKKYNPDYISRKICSEDYRLKYESDGILVKREGGIITLPKCSDYQEICGVKHHMDERDLIKEILEEEDVTKICGYNNRYFT